MTNKYGSTWPDPGDQVKFVSAEGWFYPHYTNIIANAKQNLRTGQIYTVRRCEIYSSWCCIWLEEFPGDELSSGFHLTMFEFPVE